MLFNSIQFLLFLPLVTIIYYVIPKKIRYIWLLAVSYYFYMCWNPKYALLMAASTAITFLSGMGIQYCQKKAPKQKKTAKFIVAASFASNLGILLFFKYFDWLLQNISNVFQVRLVSPFQFILPVGISFYTFQALSYTVDVYRGEMEAEKNIFRYALFVSFFPQLVAGPIERSKHLLSQLKQIDGIKLKLSQIREGLCCILYGFFLKIVVADRAAILVDQVFDNYTQYGFVELITGAALFSLQILCDFNGYSIIAKGSARLFGISLMDNFRQPYLAVSIREFWRRWHISLTSWFTDYLYIPLGGNKKGALRQMLHTVIVFFVSGLWHGASWHYVAWGMLHGMYLNIETGIRRIRACLKIHSHRLHSPLCGIFAPTSVNVARYASLIWHKSPTNCEIHPVESNFQTRPGKHNIQNEKMKFSTRAAKTFLVFLLTVVAWVFFRAPSCRAALLYFGQMRVSVQNTSLLELGLFWYDWLILAVSVMIILGVDILHEKNVAIRGWLYQQSLWFRWIIYLAAFWGIFMFGIYGVEYDASQFIYFQF
ncbi:MAG: MBOAT family protein [Lachnospiraceae bacterium]|nr:MBOAT family protein [Lachnospiraceae bacterium]